MALTVEWELASQCAVRHAPIFAHINVQSGKPEVLKSCKCRFVGEET